jgi:hypothetical protein
MSRGRMRQQRLRRRGGPVMDGMIVKNLDRPDESRVPSERGRIDLVTLDEVTVGRARPRPADRSHVGRSGGR